MPRTRLGTLRSFYRDQQGAALMEYALLAGLISLAVLATIRPVGNVIKEKFAHVEANMGRIIPAPEPPQLETPVQIIDLQVVDTQ
ncbi:MAG: Flp family type IVb pilin [Rhizobiaceae bacterium]